MGGRHLPTVSYGQSYKQTYSDTDFPEPTVFAHWDRIVSLHILLADFPVILAAQLLFVFLCYAKNSLFVSDLFQK